MTERETRSHRPVYAEAFGLVEQEVLFNRLSDVRFQALFDQSDTLVHSVGVDSNNYGEFLFISLSRVWQGKPCYLTFYSLGWHESREQWLKGSWGFYDSQPLDARAQQMLSKSEVQTLMEQRRTEIEHESQIVSPPTKRALLFRMLADLTDEDGALTELEDLGDVDWLDEE